MKVLFLARWYPNKYDSMYGLFIERHALAVSEYCDVKVIYVHPDELCREKYNYEFETNGKLKVLRIYYRVHKVHKVFKVHKVLNIICYLKSCLSGYKLLEKELANLILYM